jgi:formylglycine-generating enzyme required for sulfatase activity
LEKKGRNTKSVRLLAWLAIFLGTSLTSSVARASDGQPLELNIQMVREAGRIEILGGNGLVGIEFTTNLDWITPWSLLAMVQATSNPCFYSDASATNAPKRFYRAFVENSGNTNVLNSAPALAAIDNKTIQVGSLLTFMATASDSDLPVQTLTFSLEVGAPAGAAITSAGVFSWTPTTVQGPSTNLITVKVTDNGTPVLTATRSFTVVVTSGNINEPPANPDPPHLIWIKPGTFTMGSPTDEVDRFDVEGPQTLVTITKGFWMSKCETTQGEFLAVMGSNPSYSGFGKGDTYPVARVTWNEATNYCGKLTGRERAAGRLPAGYEYRLPTEAEWEYACLAGTTTRFSFGDDLSYAQLGDYAWYSSNSGGTSHPVGLKQPNAWGLYDMHGNVWEWCLDWLGTYPGGSVTDPRGPTTFWTDLRGWCMGSYRGGAWGTDGGICRSAFRLSNEYPPVNRFDDIGFRPVLAPGQ